jgi:putative FmdB family regulatory protein
MPIYEYRCEDCGTVIEKLQKFSDPPLTECGQCGGRLEKLLSPPGLQFKGSGWYVTDYARSGNGKNGSEKRPAPKSDTKKTESTKKSESKATAKKSD